jgi:condensin complex subunit 3
VKSLLTRTRDVDPGVRKLLYANVLLETLHHPKQLSIAQREKVVKDGLGDRDPNVRTAASRLVASWFDTLDGSFENFLRIFDLIGEPDSSSIAEEALKSVFNSRPDALDNCDFNGRQIECEQLELLNFTYRGILDRPNSIEMLLGTGFC